MSMRQLSEKSGVALNSLSVIANHKNKGISYRTVNKITKALDINFFELFEETRVDEEKIKVTGEVFSIKTINNKGEVSFDNNSYQTYGLAERQLLSRGYVKGRDKEGRVYFIKSNDYWNLAHVMKMHVLGTSE